MERLVSVLEAYRGKDRIIRFAGYVATFLAGTTKGKSALNFKTIATELSACRTVLRLFDDTSMLMSNLVYGTGSKEPVTAIRILQLISNFVNQLYYPVEHIAWLGDRKIISVESNKFWLLGLRIWATSLLTEIIKNLVKIRLAQMEMKGVKKEQYLQASNERNGITEQSQAMSDQLKALKAKSSEAYLLLFQSLFDFMNAISWMPPGFLWSGKLSPAQNGVLGMISTGIMLYRGWPAKKDKKSS
ncbi:peroxisomal membrane protein 11C-like [Ylistrum balloti]|uniref:peroxisomal membrane protein 11C-like n=1 Tax=Ylistrum balloti TaxID=509963 RepID=UPI002905880A|nr:peroxisomal membrane protein 11C-like [Ylistrum balloti]